MNKLKLIFETIEVRLSHGKEPRGRGSWAFALNRSGTEGLIFSPQMTYAEAKKWAKEEYSKTLTGIHCIFVQP